MNKSPEKIQKMFNNLAARYDFMNKIISCGTDKFIKSECVKLLNLRPQMRVLDLCTGTGDIAGIIKKACPRADITGVDFSENMLKIAEKKHPNIEFVKADCTNLPFEDNSFDFVTISYGLRNIEDYDSALKEIRRILKPDGQFMHLDFGGKTFLGNLFEILVPFFAKIFMQDNSAYKYLSESKHNFWSPQELVDIVKSYGFEKVIKKDFIFGTISCRIFK